MKNIKTFEEYLQEKHMEENPMILDDDLSDAFDDWIANLPADKFIEYADTYARQVRENALKDVSEWIDDDVGVSSKAIFMYMVKGDVPRPFDCPHDKDDRRRCIVLLQSFPEWVDRLKEIEELNLSGTQWGSDGKKTVYPWNEQIPLIREELKQYKDHDGART